MVQLTLGRVVDYKVFPDILWSAESQRTRHYDVVYTRPSRRLQGFMVQLTLGRAVDYKVFPDIL
jgi:hypothetical protein